MKKRKFSLFDRICRMNNSRLIKTVVTRMTSGKKKRGRPRTKWMSKSKYGVMGVSLTVFIGPKFTLMSLWHQWVLSHEDLNKYRGRKKFSAKWVSSPDSCSLVFDKFYLKKAKYVLRNCFLNFGSTIF